MRREIFLSTVFVLAGCAQKAPAPASQSPFSPTASIQDIMLAQIDPAADYLWASVGTVITAAGKEVRQPRTAEEWLQARHRAITLIEATNLLVMDGRRVAETGKKLEDEDTPGILTAEQSQAAIDADRATFVAFAHALHEVGVRMLTAIDAKNPAGLVEAGDALDRVCEGCHVKFWYPGAVTIAPQASGEPAG